MSDYKPSTEDMREVFVAAVRLSFKDVGASAYSIIRGVTHGGAWFDNWLAEEIRKAKAEALNEAADAFNWAKFHEEYKPIQGWLRNRAQKITEES